MNTLERIRAIWRTAKHDTRGYRARMNLAGIRERKATRERLKRTLELRERLKGYVFEVDWSGIS